MDKSTQVSRKYTTLQRLTHGSCLWITLGLLVDNLLVSVDNFGARGFGPVEKRVLCTSYAQKSCELSTRAITVIIGVRKLQFAQNF